MPPVPLILDVDTGVDDALALLYAAASPEVDVIGATAVMGNVTVEQATRNTLAVLQAAGLPNAEVAAGASAPLGRAHVPFPVVHGEGGLGRADPPEPTRSVSERSAVELIVAAVRERPGDVLLVATGPLTNVALTCVGPDGENQISVAPGANAYLSGQDVTSALGQVNEAGVVLSSLEVSREAVEAAARWAQEQSVPFVMNPAPTQPWAAEVAAIATYVTPNEHEREELGRLPDGVVIVETLGEDGVAIHRGNAVDRVEAPSVDAVDTTGAGDCFNGVFAAGLVEGLEAAAAARRAAGADALVTARVLAAAIGRQPFDLVIGGVESTDGYTGTVPAAIAELLGVPSLTFAREMHLSGDTLTIERQTAAGYDDVVSSLPAVVTVTAGATEPRYPSLKGVMAAKSKPVATLSLPPLGLS